MTVNSAGIVTGLALYLLGLVAWSLLEIASYGERCTIRAGRWGSDKWGRVRRQSCPARQSRITGGTMTCIVGVVHSGRVLLGGDSAGVAGYQLVVRADRKVFNNGDFVMGFTSSFRMGQLLAFGFSPPKPRVGEDVMAYMVTEFIDAARNRMKAGGYARIKESADEGGTFLVGYAGRLFHVGSDFQVGESVHGFDACGCGAEVALGSLRSTRSWSDPIARLQEALEAAEEFSAGVRRPFSFASQPAMASGGVISGLPVLIVAAEHRDGYPTPRTNAAE